MKALRILFAATAALVALNLRAVDFPSSEFDTLTRKKTAGGTQYDLVIGTFNIASGNTVTFKSGSTLTLSGSFGGTPTGGTLDLSNITLTLPAATIGLFQPLDSDLTAIAALSTTATGRALLTYSAASGDMVYYNGTAWTQIASTANGRSLLSVTTLSATGLGLANGAALDALAAVSSTGLLARTGSNTYTARTLTGTPNEITVANGDGVLASPTLSLPSALTFTGKTVTGGTFNSGAFNGTLGATTPSTIAATTISASGQITSTVTTGTAPFVVASTTAVSNLNASLLLGSTWASPAAIGTGTPAAGTFTTLTTQGNAINFTRGGTGGTEYVLVSGSLSGDSLFSHAFADQTAFTSTTTGGYASYDAIPAVSGTTSYNHFYAFQSRITYSGTGGGLMGTMSSFVSFPTINGPVTTFHGAHIYDPAGSGVITTNYGLLIDNMTRGSTNYAIWTGTGEVRLGGVVNVVDVTAAADTGSGSIHTAGGIGALKAIYAGQGLYSTSSTQANVYLNNSNGHSHLLYSANDNSFGFMDTTASVFGFIYTAGTSATSYFTFYSTKDASALGTAGFVLSGGLSVAKKAQFGDSITGTSATLSGNIDVNGGSINTSASVLTINKPVYVNLTAKNSFILGSAGANYGFVSNVNSTTWALGYGGTQTTLGTSALTWNDSGNVGVAGNFTVSGTGMSSVAGPLAILNASSNAASTGAIRLTNNGGQIVARNAGSSADIEMMRVDSSNFVNIAAGAAAVKITGQLSAVDTTDATNTSTGQAFSGGVAVAKALWVGGLSNIAGQLTLTSTAGLQIGSASFSSGRAITMTTPSGNTVGIRYLQSSVADWLVGCTATTGNFEVLENGTTAKLSIASATTTISNNVTLSAYGSGGGAVTVGAADSGGSGFKVLRVPN